MKISDFSFAPSSQYSFFTTEKMTLIFDFRQKVRVASKDDLRGFLKVAKDKLIHMSSQDFWELGQDEDGSYFITRLADDSQGPIKE